MLDLQLGDMQVSFWPIETRALICSFTQSLQNGCKHGRKYKKSVGIVSSKHTGHWVGGGAGAGEAGEDEEDAPLDEDDGEDEEEEEDEEDEEDEDRMSLSLLS